MPTRSRHTRGAGAPVDDALVPGSCGTTRFTPAEGFPFRVLRPPGVPIGSGNSWPAGTTTRTASGAAHASVAPS